MIINGKVHSSTEQFSSRPEPKVAMVKSCYSMHKQEIHCATFSLRGKRCPSAICKEEIMHAVSYELQVEGLT